MNKTAHKLISFFLVWLLFYNFICISFSIPKEIFPQNKPFKGIVQEGIFVQSSYQDKTSKKEKESNRFNIYIELSSLLQTKSLGSLSFNKIVLRCISEKVHFTNFLTSHFATST